MSADEILRELYGILLFTDKALKDAGPAGLFPGPELRTLSRVGDTVERILRALGSDPAAPPWDLENAPERPERDLPWSAALCGDEVLAPNGQWYGVDSWSRTGRTVAVLLVMNGAKVKSVRDAGQVVRVRRGPAGQAADMFTDAGFKLEVLAA